MDIRFNLVKPTKRRTSTHQTKIASIQPRTEVPIQASFVQQENSTTYKRNYSAQQEKGLNYEQEALDFLLNQGLILLTRNLACKMGEIDLIMLDQQTLVFIEVRFRQNNSYGGAIASITPAKYHRLQRTAHYFLPYLARKFFQNQLPKCRFDAICIDGKSTEKIWLKNITL